MINYSRPPKRNIRYEEEQCVSWANCFPCIAGERFFSDDSTSKGLDNGRRSINDNDGDDADDGEGQSRSETFTERESLSIAVDYMDKMKRELATKHRQIKLAQKVGF